MKKKVILLGDSITEAFPHDFSVNNYDFINKGISGDNTNGVLKRLNNDVIAEKPDILFILIGTNDFAQGKSNQEIETNIYKILRELSSSLRNTGIYAVSILPVRNIDNRSNKRITEVNKRINDLSRELGINYFDLHHHFKDESGMLKNNFTEDGLHLTAEAYKLWGELLKNLLVKSE